MYQSHSHVEGERVAGAREAAEAQATGARSWFALGYVSGILGALVVAVFFFLVDLVEGTPLWTPTALGSALFRGEALPEQAAWQPGLVLGYTLLHGAVFMAWGALAAFLLTLVPLPRSGVAVGAIASGALFVLFEVNFLVLARLFEPRLLESLGAGRIALANLLAAGTMGLYLTKLSRRTGGTAREGGARAS